MPKEKRKMIGNYSLWECISFIWYYILGHIIGRLHYKKEYYYGAWFKGRFFGVAAPGWRWICDDYFFRNYHTSKVLWPCSPSICIVGSENIHFSPDDINIFQGTGNYFQAINGGHIYIGKGTWIASGVGIITSNHNIYNPAERGKTEDILIGEKCWIGMNSIILPGVELGPHTVVGAGAVVTKSFKDGYCVIAGNPARVVRILSQE